MLHVTAFWSHVMDHLVEQWKENTLRLLFSTDFPHMGPAPRVIRVRILAVPTITINSCVI